MIKGEGCLAVVLEKKLTCIKNEIVSTFIFGFSFERIKKLPIFQNKKIVYFVMLLLYNALSCCSI